MANGRGSGGGFGKVILGFFLAVVVIAVGALVYFKWGSPPVATADKPFPFEKSIVKVPLGARIDREMKSMKAARRYTARSARLAMGFRGTTSVMRSTCIRPLRSCGGSIPRAMWLG